MVKKLISLVGSPNIGFNVLIQLRPKTKPFQALNPICYCFSSKILKTSRYAINVCHFCPTSFLAILLILCSQSHKTVDSRPAWLDSSFFYVCQESQNAAFTFTLLWPCFVEIRQYAILIPSAVIVHKITMGYKNLFYFSDQLLALFKVKWSFYIINVLLYFSGFLY